MNELPIMSIGRNPWLMCSILLTVRVMLPGVAWAWMLPGREGKGKLSAIILAGTTASLVGLLISLFTALILAEAGIYRPALEWTVVLGISAVGIVCGAIKARSRLLETVVHCLPTVALLMVGTAAIMLLPRQGEWIVGGWDPGTYVNQGVHVSHTGGFRPAPDTVFSRLTPEEFGRFTRRAATYIEGLPVFPIDSESRSYRFFFFRLAPTLIAIADRCGGLRAATRINLIMGLFCVLAFAGAVAAQFPRRTTVVLSVLFLIVQPIWIYHLHVPVSEMLQLFLFCALLSCLPFGRRSTFARALVALCLFAMVVNRFSFLPFASLLLLVLSWHDLDCLDRLSVIKGRALQIMALMAAVWFDHWACMQQIEWMSSTRRLIASSSILLLCALGLDLAARRESWRLRLMRVIPVLALVAFCFAALLVPVLALISQKGIFGGFWQNTAGIMPYFGWPLLCCAIPGVLVFAAKTRVTGRLFKGIIFFLLCATGITLIDDWITNLFPWATRRYLVFSVPAIAILAGYAATMLWDAAAKAGVIRRVVVVAVVLGALAATASRSRDAWAGTEYDGLSKVLAEVSERIDQNDILVTDHPLFGVPLKFIWGKQILNGELLWRERQDDEMQQAVATLKRLAEGGSRIRFLTSTPEGMMIFPFQLKNIRKDWSSGPIALRDIQHGDRVSGFKLREVEHVFELYTWMPGAEAEVLTGLWKDSLDLDVGEGVGTPYDGLDTAYLVTGFYRPEMTGDRTVRWTSDRAVMRVYIAKPQSDLKAEVQYLDLHRPASFKPYDLSFSFNGNQLESVLTAHPDTPDVRVATMTIPRDHVRNADNIFVISCDAWVPNEHFDTRLLGIMIDRVRIGPTQPRP